MADAVKSRPEVEVQDVGKTSIPAYVLDDLSSRFIINSRPEEIRSIIRIFFLIEIAYWFYLDFHRVENPKLKECSMKEFSFCLISHCPQLRQFLSEFDKHFEAWKQYKRTIATYGAIVLDKDLKHVLLVQSYSSKNSWGFPKGKINQNESPVNCAAREVFEETGFDIKPYVDPEEFLEKSSNEQVNRLYIIAGVPLETEFQPKTRREIRDIQWFPIATLPTHKGDQTLNEAMGQNYNLYTITLFLRPLRKWISNRQQEGKQKGKAKPGKTQGQPQGLDSKKSKVTSKSLAGQKAQTVRYSKDMEVQEQQVKQGKRGMTVFQSLFGNRDSTHQAAAFKAPVVDTKSFHSKTWQNFSLDVDGIVSLLPNEGVDYFQRQAGGPRSKLL